MKSRRQFIQRCSTALMGAAVLPAAGLASAATTRRTTFSDYTAQVNSSFVMTDASGAELALTLQAAEPAFPNKKPELAHHRNFKLKFASTATESVQQGTYSFSHPVLGEQRIFVVPQVSKTGLMNYVAIFHGEPVMG